MRDLFIKRFTEFNAFIIRMSNGKLGSQLGTQSILMLHTTGRKSGRSRSTPIAYFEYWGRYLLVGTNWGRQKQADWFLNLKKQLHARIEVKGRTLEVQARESQGDECARLWEYVAERHAPYSKYQRMTSRHIPIVVLEPAR